MSGKFDMRICNCGRIHMIPNEKVDKALESDKRLLLICGGCGNAKVIGADIESNWVDEESDKPIYNMYSYDFSPYKDTSIFAENFEGYQFGKPFSEIFYSHGITVPMMTGTYAQHYRNGIFQDIWYPNLWEIERADVTVEEVKKFIEKWRVNMITVDMNRLLRENKDEALEELSRHYIPAFNWKGTKFEKKD